MITVDLDLEYPSALIYRPKGELRVQAPTTSARFVYEGVPTWTYAYYDSDVGIFHQVERDLGRIPLDANMSSTKFRSLAKAAAAIQSTGLKVARFRREYRDLDGYRKPVFVDFYLPLPAELATEPDAPRPTREEAKERHLQGWNLRCNRCGGWGATWIRRERPRWGALALCGPHARELAREHDRHAQALDELRMVCFEQPPEQGHNLATGHSSE